MRFVKWGYVLLLLFFVSGCTRITTKQVDSRTQEAKNLLKNVILTSQKIQMKEFSEVYDLIRQSQEKLEQADGKRAAKESIRLVEESIRLSVLALSKIAQSGAEHSIQMIQKRGDTSSLKDLLIEFNNIAIRAKGMEEGVKLCRPEELSMLVKSVDDMIIDVDIKQAIVRSNFNKIIEDKDIEFQSGRYRPSGKLLAEILKEVSEKLVDFLKLYPNTNMINIKTTGYADAQPFSEGTAETLHSQCANIPSEGNAHRRALNQCLSKLRAKSIGIYIEKEILKKIPNLQIKREFIGKGEELPEGVSPPYPQRDPRRRICIVDITVVPAK